MRNTATSVCEISCPTVTLLLTIVVIILLGIGANEWLITSRLLPRTFVPTTELLVTRTINSALLRGTACDLDRRATSRSLFRT